MGSVVGHEFVRRELLTLVNEGTKVQTIRSPRAVSRENEGQVQGQGQHMLVYPCKSKILRLDRLLHRAVPVVRVVKDSYIPEHVVKDVLRTQGFVGVDKEGYAEGYMLHLDEWARMEAENQPAEESDTEDTEDSEVDEELPPDGQRPGYPERPRESWKFRQQVYFL
jgi:hypothetical protein